MNLATRLDNLRVIRVSGKDGLSFLQGQLTADIDRLVPGRAQLAGWADARGRLLAVMHVLGTGDDILLLLPADIAEPVCRRLGMFVLRASAAVEIAPMHVYGLLTETPDSPPTGSHLAVLAADHSRAYLVSADGKLPASTGPGSWELADIRAGVPQVTTATQGEFIPQMANLDLLDAISFTKGCYVGQEIVARTHYRGRVKRRMLRFACSGNHQPGPGDTVYGSRGQVGQVVRAARADQGTELLAVIVLDDLATALALDTNGEQPLEQLSLPYTIPELRGSAG